MSEEDRVIAQKEPYAVELEAGKGYAWCRCGRSQNQPFCDGAHKGTGIVPKMVKVDKTDTYYLCGCKQTDDEPFCDGTHNSL